MSKFSGEGAMSGAVSGAMIGSKILPGWGTAIGAVGGGLFGGLMGGDDEEIGLPMRDMRKEGLESIDAYGAAMPGVLTLKRRHDPEFINQSLKNQGQAMGGFSDLFEAYMPRYARLQSQADYAGGQEYLDLAGDISGKYRSTERQLNPELDKLMNMRDDMASYEDPTSRNLMFDLTGLSKSGGVPSRISPRIEAYAYDLVGKGLTDREKRTIEQGVRSGYRDRGMFRSNKALMDEVMTLTSEDENRIARNALTAQELERGITADTAGRMSLLNTGVNSVQDLIDRRYNRLGVAVNDRFKRYVNPYQALGPSRTGMSGAEMYSSASGVAGSTPLFDPFNAYASDVYSSNQNAVAALEAAKLSDGGMMDGLMGGFMGGAGQAFGSSMFSS